MFRRAAGSRDRLRHLDRVEAWTRERFRLPEEAIVLVSEEPGRQPGYPPLQTTVLFWTDRGTRHRFRVFKPVAEIVEGDLPVAWMLPALLDDGDAECC